MLEVAPSKVFDTQTPLFVLVTAVGKYRRRNGEVHRPFAIVQKMCDEDKPDWFGENSHLHARDSEAVEEKGTFWADSLTPKGFTVQASGDYFNLPTTEQIDLVLEHLKTGMCIFVFVRMCM